MVGGILIRFSVANEDGFLWIQIIFLQQFLGDINLLVRTSANDVEVAIQVEMRSGLENAILWCASDDRGEESFVNDFEEIKCAWDKFHTATSFIVMGVEFRQCNLEQILWHVLATCKFFIDRTEDALARLPHVVAH